MVLTDLTLVPVIRRTVIHVRLVTIVSKEKDFLVRVQEDFTVQLGLRKKDSFIKFRSFGKGQADRRTKDMHSTLPLIQLNVPFIPTMILVMLLPLMIVTIVHQDTSVMKLELAHCKVVNVLLGIIVLDKVLHQCFVQLEGCPVLTQKLKVCWIVPLVKLENIVQNQVFQN